MPPAAKKPAPKTNVKGAAPAAAAPAIRPPTKAQIAAARGAVRGDGPVVVNAACIDQLLNRHVAKEFADEAPLDLTRLQPPQQPQQSQQQQQQIQQQQQLQQQQMYQQQQQLPQQQMQQLQQQPQQYQQPQYQNLQQQQPYQEQQQQFQNQQPKQQHQQYQQQHQQQQQLQQQQQQPFVDNTAPVVRKKPSEMTPEEYAAYERGREASNWRRLVDINVWRTPSTFERNECADLLKSSPAFAALHAQELARKQQAEGAKPRAAEPLRPEPRRTDQGRFNPSQEPSFQIPQVLAAPMQNAPQQGVYQSDAPQSGVLQQQQLQLQQQQQQQQQIQFLQQQLLQLQQPTAVLAAQAPQSANQHLLQNIQEAQLELQITQQQASKHQLEAIRLERENGQLRLEVQQEKQLRQGAEFKVQQMGCDLEELRAQICDLRDRLQRAGGAGAAQSVNVQDVTPVTLQRPPPQDAFVRPAVAAPPVLSQQQQLQQQDGLLMPPRGAAPPPRAAAREDPNFTSLAVNDIEAIMKNANIILNKYQDFDQSLNTPAGLQVKQAYRNLMKPAAQQAPPAQASDDEEDIAKLLESDDHMNTIEMNQAPTDIPASILNQIPDGDDEGDGNVYEAQAPQSSQKQYQDEVEEYKAEHVGSLLPKSKYNSRNQVMRK